MMFLTPGTSFTPRCTACETILWPTLTLTLPMPGERARAGRATSFRSASSWLLRRIAELDVDDDVRAVDLDLAHRLGRTKSRPVFGSISARRLA